MRLYHGSNVEVVHVDLRQSRRYRDFGRGFYLSDNYLQALAFSEQVRKRRGTGASIVSVFEFDAVHLDDGSLSVRRFEDYTKEGARFVVMNRKYQGLENPHKYDVVYGPIADDKVALQIDLYLLQEISFQTLVENLRYRTKTFQYCFASERAVQTLRRV